MSAQSVFLNNVQNNYKEIQLKDFDKFYEEFKNAIDSMHSRTFNNHFHIVDEHGRRYKLIRRKGQNQIIRVSPDEYLNRHHIMNRMAELEGKINECSKLLDKLDKQPDELTEEDVIKFNRISKEFNI